MKKKLFAIVLTLCLALGLLTFAACKKDEKAVQMNEELWEKAFASLNTDRNLSITLPGQGYVKINKTDYYDRSESGYERYLTVDGTSYYRYEKSADETEWTKTSITAENYNNIVMQQAFSIVLVGAQAIGDAYGSFTLDNGVYKAASIAIEEASDALTDVQVTFDGTKLVKVVCTVTDMDMTVTIDDIGSTEVKIPEIEEKPFTGVAGKTYVCYKSINVDMSSDLYNMMKADLYLYQYAFATDASGTMTNPSNATYPFTYTIKGNAISVNLSNFDMSVIFSIDGDELIWHYDVSGYGHVNLYFRAQQ